MGGNGITVLVVEDEALVRMDVALLLEDEGFECWKHRTPTTPSACPTHIRRFV